MSIQRANPVPPGIYWIWQAGPALPVSPEQSRNRQTFAKWLELHREHIKILSTSSTSDGGWYLLEFLQTVKWEGPGLLSFGRRGMTEGDTISRPDPEKSGLPAIGSAVSSAVWWIGAGVVGYTLWTVLGIGDKATDLTDDA